MEFIINESQLHMIESAKAQIGLLVSLSTQITQKNIVIEQHCFSEALLNLQEQLAKVLEQVHKNQ